MPEGFQTIPDWFSFENQGAGVAITDFGDGQQHLVVLMVDDPPQQNRGLYRIGHKLDGEGRVTGNWTPWIDVPDWFSSENQGADIAVADLSSSGGRDLVVFMIDNPPQQNRGLYRIGKKLDANGNVAEWTPWIEVPGWFSWENQGGGIAVTSPDAQGRRNLVVFMIDNPPGKNRGFYRIGKAVDANGNVTGGWTDWLEVPDWFSFENQGGAITIADFDGDGSDDLVVFMIDNVIQAGDNGGQNQGYYKVGSKLDANGGVAKWDDWLPLPYWFSWENQGGGIDVAKLQGQKKLISLIVDNPPGKNEGLYQVVSADASPATVGRWDQVFDLKNVAVHVSVLPNGKVLYWGRTDQRGDNRDINPHICTPWIWDPKTGQQTMTQPPHPTLQDGHTTVNLFCSGHAFMPDGRLLVAGGHLADSNGSPQASLYDYRNNTWSPLPPMNKGRWYPTVTPLPDGKLLASSGSYIENGQTINNPAPQLWDGNQWKETVTFFGLPLYPRMLAAPNGQVFMAGSNAKTYMLNVGTNTWTPLAEPGGVRRNGERQYAPSVMYDAGKVIYIGGGNDPGISNIPTDQTEIIDLGASPPTWENTERMHFRRRHHNATLLPDGTILVTGGTMGHDFNDLEPGRPVHTAELWDPKTKSWTLLAAEKVDRCYHGTAVLLPDATVLSGGGGEFNINGPGLPSKGNDPKDSHYNAQIFHPPYLFRGSRPEIIQAPEEIEYGEAFTVQIAGPEVGQVTWIRLSSVTHAFNENQFINFLGFQSGNAGLTVTAPAKPELCPPGHYMLFALSKAGVPSIAHFVRIGPSTARPHAISAAAGVRTGYQGGYEGRSPIEERDELVRRSTGTRVTIGLTARCPYGLAACWGGAYEALKKLSRVEAVRPIANTDVATAELFLRDQGLPDLDHWPEEFVAWANRSYDFRGVEVEIAGTLREEAGELELIGAAFPAPVRLRPLAQGIKVQWDYAARKPQEATANELQAYDNLRQQLQSARDAGKQVRVTGPLAKTAAGWVLYVREFER
jgi:galactose oxidase